MHDHHLGKGYHFAEQTEHYGFLSLAPAQMPHDQLEREQLLPLGHNLNVQQAEVDEGSASSSAVYEGTGPTSSQGSTTSNKTYNLSLKGQYCMTSKDFASCAKMLARDTLECDNLGRFEATELRLGLGPPCHPPSSDFNHAPLQLQKDRSAFDKLVASAAHAPSTLWPTLYVSNPQNSSHEEDAGRSSSAVITKNGVKRGYNDAMMQNPLPHCGMMPLVRNSAHGAETKQFLVHQLNVQAPPYINLSTHATVEASGGIFSDIHLKVPPGECQDKGNHSTQHDAPNDKFQVIGWPPVRASRKNNLAAHTKPVDVVAESDETEDALSKPLDPCLFVKVNMQGVPIGRKVDLNACKGYEELSFALNNMFQKFTTENKSVWRNSCAPADISHINLFSGSDYVLTYEDKEGDWMLVGDVPWGMFISSVRRLLITKRA